MDFLPHEKKIQEYLKTIEHLKKQSQDSPLFKSEIQRLEEALEEMKMTVYAELTPWERIQICRHPDRPHTVDYIEHLCEDFHELCGDRLYGDDRSVIGGLATINGINCMLIGQEKGHDTESRVKHNFGMLHPEGFRKALRLMKLAEKFHIPIVNLIDTPGAHPGLDAEERGIGSAIAVNLREMAMIEVPIIVIVIGEGSSGGALGMGIGDVVGMLQHGYYSVISPEACSSILWKDNAKKMEAAKALKLNSENLLQFKVIDAIIEEPLGGAHHDPAIVYKNVSQFIVEQLELLTKIPPKLLLEQRYLRFRALGAHQKETISSNGENGNS